MDKKTLNEYEEQERLAFHNVRRRIREGRFTFEKDRYPPNDRFVKLQRPVALTTLGTVKEGNFWIQVPFSGSLILLIPPLAKAHFERFYFPVSEIPKIIDFIKETGRLQIAFSANPLLYEHLDYLDPFFIELNPPVYAAAPDDILGNKKEIKMAVETFRTLGKVKYFDYLKKVYQQTRMHQIVLEKDYSSYITLKLNHYEIVEVVENLLIDEPSKAFSLLGLCETFIDQPFRDLRSDLRNFTLEEILTSRDLPLVYGPRETRFPIEIGRFLMKKLTYAPLGPRACLELIDHYDAYDLREVAESLNDAILEGDPDAVNRSAFEISEILDDAWNDPTIPRRIKGLRIGVPISIAAIGAIAAGPIGAAGGFLAGMGLSALDGLVDTEAVTEKIAKSNVKNYQVNIYDFKDKYDHRTIKRPLDVKARTALDKEVQKSLDTVMKSAVNIARSQGRSKVTKEDLEEAIKRRPRKS